jgi:predicted glycogen debranching enzyme
MLPNRVPEAGQTPEYNTVDATLWYFQALYHSYQARGITDPAFRELYPVLVDMIDWYARGTRYNIHLDENDGLLYAGEAGIQLTWMDAKIEDWVVTPRTGKPVEINALWYNALRITAELATEFGFHDDARRFGEMAARAYASFNERFWYSGGYLYDVIDGPDDSDPTLRPNQIFAVSLPFPLLEGDRARAVVNMCARELVISYGLRSLGSDETNYVGHYSGDAPQRDSIYHQGPAWSWLLGPFVIAHYRVYGDAQVALSYLEPIANHLTDHGLGTVSEIFDGDPAHTPHGCIAQAWGVAEVLRAWRVLQPALSAARAEPPPNRS